MTFAGNGFPRVYGEAAEELAGIADVDLHSRKLSELAVVTDCQSRANFHRALGRALFVIVLRLLEKVNRRFVLVVLDEVRRFVEANAARSARGVDIPRPRNVLWLLACFVRHRNVFY